MNRTLDYFDPSSTSQSQTDFFYFRLLLYTVEVTATQSQKLKSIRHLRKPPNIESLPGRCNGCQLISGDVTNYTMMFKENTVYINFIILLALVMEPLQHLLFEANTIESSIISTLGETNAGDEKLLATDDSGIPDRGKESFLKSTRMFHDSAVRFREDVYDEFASPIRPVLNDREMSNSLYETDNNISEHEEVYKLPSFDFIRTISSGFPDFQFLRGIFISLSA